MIYPPPFDLGGQDPAKREENLPRAAIDAVTYPPFRLVWCLEVFEKTSDTLIEETLLENFDIEEFRRIYGRPSDDPMVEGGWPVTDTNRREIEMLIGWRLNLSRFEYFVAASALNLSEVKNAHD